jgi:cell wall-associated NlpC family hydrolase
VKKVLAVLAGLVAAALAVVVFAGGSVVSSPLLLAGGGDDSGSTSSSAGCVPATGVAAGKAATVIGLNADQLTIANTIISVGVQRGVPTRGLIVALATGMQESRLRNLPYGDRDSLGVFQQRPSQGWKNVMDVPYAAGAFYDTLLRVPGWEGMPVTVAAQRAQRSGHPDAYRQWEDIATRTVTAALGQDAVTEPVAAPTGCVTQPADAAPVPVAAAGVVAAVIAAGQTQLGVDYSWGGGSLTGPSTGFGAGARTSGFDCSSFVRYAVYQGSGGRVTIPRTTREQYTAGRKVAKDQLQPGDLLFFASNTSNPGSIHHVGMYLGDGRMLHAPKTGDVVKVVPLDLTSGYWARQFIGATRPVTPQGAQA